MIELPLISARFIICCLIELACSLFARKDMPTLFLYTSKRANPVFAQTFGERNFRQMLLTHQDLCSLGEQLFRESIRDICHFSQNSLVCIRKNVIFIFPSKILGCFLLMSRCNEQEAAENNKMGSEERTHANLRRS
jgi:hypothetical protein